MASTPGEVPQWLQDDHSEVEGGEDVSLSAGHEYAQPPRRSWFRRCAIPVFVCLAVAGLAIGLTVYFTGKNPKELAETADDWVEDNVPGFGDGGKDDEKEEYSDEPTEFIFFSDEFEDGDALPSKFMSSGEGESPALSWKNLPEGTESLVLLFDEPSDDPGEDGEIPPAKTFWVAYDIPVAANGVPEGLPNAERVELTRDDTDEGNGGNDIFMLQGLNSWGAQAGDGGEDSVPPIGSFGYRPPDKDDGDEKQELRILFFRLLALKETLDGSLDPSFATAQEVRKEAREVGILGELSIQVSINEGA